MAIGRPVDVAAEIPEATRRHRWLAAVFVLINFVVDMVYVVLDPRIRYS